MSRRGSGFSRDSLRWVQPRDGENSSVSGGSGNEAEGDESSVSGGTQRHVTGTHERRGGSLFEDFQVTRDSNLRVAVPFFIYAAFSMSAL